jgi:hypothetical protein
MWAVPTGQQRTAKTALATERLTKLRITPSQPANISGRILTAVPSLATIMLLSWQNCGGTICNPQEQCDMLVHNASNIARCKSNQWSEYNAQKEA